MTQNLPIFKVAADQGKHPPVGLDRPVCVVGRKDYVNLPLPAKEVSKLHALIVREQRRVYLRDLASTNGVEVNGESVREVGLSDADIVRIGSYTLRCQSGFGQKGQRPSNGDGEAAAGADAPTAELRGKAGNFSFPPGRHTLLIGQRPGCDARLKHASVAPVHAVVFEMDGRHYVQTFAPEIATRVNGRPIHREALQPGDELLIGEIALRYALVDLAAETSGAATTSMETGTGESLIQPVLDSSITPAIDPSHHGELEPEEAAEVAFDVVEGEHESMITPAMESSVAPAVEPTVEPAADAPAPVSEPAAEEDYGLDIEPIEDESETAPAPAAEATAPERPAQPPPATEPPAKAIAEPVIEPVVERALESGIAAAIDPIKKAAAAGGAVAAGAAAAAAATAAAAAAGKAAAELGKSADLGKSMHGDDDDDIPFDLEPVGSSSDLEPIGLNPQPEPESDGDLEESFRTNWDAAAKKSDGGKLSATFDEDNELEPIDLSPKPASDAAGLSATFDEDDAMIPLTDAVSDEAGLLDAEPIDIGSEFDAPLDMPPPSAKKRPPAAAPAAAQATESPLLDSIVGAAPTTGANPLAPATADADDAAAKSDSTDQAAKLAELAKAAGLSGDHADGDAATAAVIPAAAEITALVEEVAERAQVLKEAWGEFNSENGEGSASFPAPKPELGAAGDPEASAAAADRPPAP